MSPTAPPIASPPPITCAHNLPGHLWCAPCSAANRAHLASAAAAARRAPTTLHDSHPPSSYDKEALSRSNTKTSMAPTPLIHTATERHAHNLGDEQEVVIIQPEKKVHFTPTALSEGKSKLGRRERRSRRPSNAEVKARRLEGCLLDTSGKKLAWEDFCRSDEEWERDGSGEERGKRMGDEESGGKEEDDGGDLASDQRKKRAGKDKV